MPLNPEGRNSRVGCVRPSHPSRCPPSLVDQRTEHVFYHPAEALNLHQREAADAAIILPRDKGKFVTRVDVRPFPYIFGQHHLPPLINGQHRLHPAPGSRGTAGARGALFSFLCHNLINRLLFCIFMLFRKIRKICKCDIALMHTSIA